ncbi:MAG: carbamoyltransferase [Myxococcota bacterium]
MYILGISAGMHDSSAALIKGGRIICFAEEERFIREKHTGKVPLNAIRFCLDYAKISPQEVSAIGFFWKPFKGLGRRLLNSIKYSKNPLYIINKKQPGYLLTMLKIPYILRREFGFVCPFYNLDHYLCHIASVLLTSPFESSAFLIADGNGELQTICGGISKKEKTNIVIQNFFPYSIGLVYMSITEYLGFKGNSDEGKTMGLAPFGTTRFVEKFRKIIHANGDGKIDINLRYFDYHYSKKEFVTPLFEKEFGPRRKNGEGLENHHRDVAFAIQSVTEEILIHILEVLKKRVDISKIALGGGVFLNSVVNDKIRRNFRETKIFIPPWVNDAGAAIGAALILSQRLDKDFQRQYQPSCYLGPEFSEREIEDSLNKFGIKYYRSNDIFTETANEIANGKIIGWFQGRMEAGPRALGNRSILADPRKREMKDILNLKVKHRENFRPFAPAVLLENADEYFDIDIESPYMLFACPVRPNKTGLIPSVVHIDNTARIQTVSRESNERFYNLISAFDRLTGIPVVLNTSFNIAGEPIVCTPEDAIKSYLTSEIDVLVMGDFIARKKRG